MVAPKRNSFSKSSYTLKIKPWKFRDFKHHSSLRLLAYILGIPSPKEDLDGSQIRSVYYGEGNVECIAKYCELDVVTTAQVFLRLRNDELLTEDHIVHI
ncbi:hypothetical protein [Robiginitalea sp.]|uniref:hypothetical protein n=1 Tax=Robiginitalea sp. TaxID=1902411 RepID=UPI003C78AC2B